MTDIVERLRAAPSEIGTMTQAVEHMREAADEIERLRAALEALLDDVDGHPVTLRVREQVRAALERK